jgi:pimeloyl-ACP methyl ester carboxylesterase
MSVRLLSGLLAVAMAVMVGPAWAQSLVPLSELAAEDLSFNARDDGYRLFLRNKHPKDYYAPHQADRTILFLHGATFPGSATFDVPLETGSWMDYMAQRGYDVYALDIRGFGKSTHPPALEQPAETNPPQVTTETALRDVDKAVEYILSRRGLDRLVLVGWSWGATLAGSYTVRAVAKVDRLVLYSPQWLSETPPPEGALEKLGAWREVGLAAVKERWRQAAPEGERRDLIPEPVGKSWLDALEAIDPLPGALKVPNGPVADFYRFWAAGKPMWQPERVSVPTLVIQGEWDVETPPDMGLSVFARLTGAPQRRYILIGEGSHALLMEKNRRQLFSAVQSFIAERF